MTAPVDKRKPWMKFYPADWQADEGLRQCGLTARGLWIEMIAVMHKAPRYGHLLIAGHQPTAAQLAGQVGADLKAVKAALVELEQWGVFSRAEDGAIYCRRMVEDERKDRANIENGKTGGNPLLNGKGKSKPTRGVNPPHNPTVNQGDNHTDNGGLKAQRLEARKEDKQQPLSSFQDSHESEPPLVTPTRTVQPRHLSPYDPPEAWLHLADRNPDGSPKRENEPGTERHGKPIAGGSYLDVAAQHVAEEAGWPGDWRGDWSLLAEWLRGGADLHEHILPTVKRLTDGLRRKPGGELASTLRYFDNAVRTAGRMRA